MIDNVSINTNNLYKVFDKKPIKEKTVSPIDKPDSFELSKTENKQSKNKPKTDLIAKGLALAGIAGLIVFVITKNAKNLNQKHIQKIAKSEQETEPILNTTEEVIKEGKELLETIEKNTQKIIEENKRLLDPEIHEESHYISEEAKKIARMIKKANNWQNQYIQLKEQNKTKEAEKAFIKATRCFEIANEECSKHYEKNNEVLHLCEKVRKKKEEFQIRFRDKFKLNVKPEVREQINKINQTTENVYQYNASSDTLLDGFRYYNRSPKFNAQGIAENPRFLNQFEVLVIDRTKDIALKKSIEALKTKITPDMDESQKALTLMKHIEEIFRPSEEKGSILITNGKEKDIKKTFTTWITDRLPKKEILIGDFIEKGESHIRPGIGVCRHRALLAQVLGKEIGLDISLASGEVGKGTDKGLHAWNEIIVKGEKIVYDPMNLKAINLKTKEMISLNEKIASTSQVIETYNKNIELLNQLIELNNDKLKSNTITDKSRKTFLIKENESFIKDIENYNNKIQNLLKEDIDWYNAPYNLD